MDEVTRQCPQTTTFLKRKEKPKLVKLWWCSVNYAIEVIQLIWEGGVIVCRCRFLFILGTLLKALPHCVAVGYSKTVFQVYFGTVLLLF